MVSLEEMLVDSGIVFPRSPITKCMTCMYCEFFNKLLCKFQYELYMSNKLLLV